MPANTRTQVGVIGSPSSTTHVVLNIIASAYQQPLYGQMIAFTVTVAADLASDPSVTRDELAVGTVTLVETTNNFHTAAAPEAHLIAAAGQIQNKSGHAGDIRSVKVGVEAVFRREEDRWIPAGNSLSNSPATGTPVTLVDQAQVDDLMTGVENQRHVGRLHGSAVRVPYTQRDFSTARGAVHDVIAGQTGAGKTTAAAWMMATDLVYDTFGQVIFDPQGQWASEAGMTVSLQGVASAAGRKVTVARLSRSLRLRKDAPMLAELVAKAGIFTELAFGAGADAQIANACRVMVDALDDRRALLKSCGTEDWTEANPADLMIYLLADLRDVLPLGTVYSGKDGQQRVRQAIQRPTADELVEEGQADATTAEELAARYRPGVLDERPTTVDPSGGRRWRNVFTLFNAVHNLWSPFTPEGAWQVWGEGVQPGDLPAAELRQKAWPLFSEVFIPKAGQPSPWVILDLSADYVVPGERADGDEEALVAASKTRAVLDHPGVKARIMLQLINDALLSAQAAFKEGRALNFRVTFDEAWQYAMQPDVTTDKAVAALSDRLEDAARDARKLGGGFRFILQAVTGLREGIWKQCAARIIGYGMTEQSDLKRIENVVGPDHLRLYTSLAGPDATGTYPFMFCGGGVTGLSFGAKPVFLDMFTTPGDWLSANEQWLTKVRAKWAHLLPSGDAGGPLAAMPGRPAGTAGLEPHLQRKVNLSATTNQSAAAALVSNAKVGSKKKPFGIVPHSGPRRVVVDGKVTHVDSEGETIPF